jgi:ferredoxin
MPNRKNIWPKNAKGQFYVDRTCIGCNQCCTTAPRHFQMDEVEGHSCLVKQPTSPAEVRRCQEAMKGCPVQAIGEDGAPVPLVTPGIRAA